MFSLLTGEMYTIERDEYKNMDKYQLPLHKKPSSSCKKCYGRMHVGRNITLGIYALCTRCADKCVDFNLFKNEHLDIETIKHA